MNINDWIIERGYWTPAWHNCGPAIADHLPQTRCEDINHLCDRTDYPPSCPLRVPESPPAFDSTIEQAVKIVRAAVGDEFAITIELAVVPDEGKDISITLKIPTGSGSCVCEIKNVPTAILIALREIVDSNP